MSYKVNVIYRDEINASASLHLNVLIKTVLQVKHFRKYFITFIVRIVAEYLVFDVL